MIYSENYHLLIGHENYEITVLDESKNILVYKVYILSKNKKILEVLYPIKKNTQRYNGQLHWS